MARRKPAARIVAGVPKPASIDPGFAAGGNARIAAALGLAGKQQPSIDPGFAAAPAGAKKPLINQPPLTTSLRPGAGGPIGVPDLLPGNKPATAPAPTVTAPAAASAQSSIAALLQPFIDQINNTASRRSTEGTNAIKGYTSQLAQSLATSGPAGVSAAYDPAKAALAASSSAFADRLQGAGNQSANDLAARLASIEAPAATDAATGALRDAAAGSSNASYGIGNAALQGLISNEADAQAFANKMPAIANLSGLQGEKALQAQINNETATSLGQLRSQVPGLVQNQLALEAKRQQINPTLSAAMGVAVNEYGDPVLKGGKPVPYAKPATSAGQILKTGNGYVRVAPDGTVTDLGVSPPASTGSFKIVKGADGYYRVNPDGSTAPLGITPPTSSKSGGASHLQSKTINGHVATFDPTTGTYYIPGTNTPVDPNTFTKPAKAVSSSQMQKARSFLQQQASGFYASQADPSKPVSASAIAAAAKNATMTVGDFLADTPEAAKARADAGIGWNQIVHGKQSWPEVQQLYLTLVKQYGIPARQAFGMVAGTYKEWGAAHKDAYFPKADAAQGAAQPAAYVTVAPTANRPGVGLNPAVTQFVGRVGELAGRKLTIGTGTNHNEYVVGTHRESAHWTGNAADIPASGATLTRLGQDALIAAGMPPAQARKQTGGLYNIGNYQVIFNSMEGGNHFNHLHVGLRGSLT